jgi:hypothetical protein
MSRTELCAQWLDMVAGQAQSPPDMSAPPDLGHAADLAQPPSSASPDLAQPSSGSGGANGDNGGGAGGSGQSQNPGVDGGHGGCEFAARDLAPAPLYALVVMLLISGACRRRSARRTRPL